MAHLSPDDPIFDAAAQQYNVNPDILRSVMLQESGGNTEAVGPKTESGDRALGLMQFMPDTARQMGIDPYDPQQAVPAAAKLLSRGFDQGEALAQSNPNVDPLTYGLMTYYGGDNTDKWGKATFAYPGQVAAQYRKLTGGDGSTSQPVLGPQASSDSGDNLIAPVSVDSGGPAGTLTPPAGAGNGGAPAGTSAPQGAADAPAPADAAPPAGDDSARIAAFLAAERANTGGAPPAAAAAGPAGAPPGAASPVPSPPAGTTAPGAGAAPIPGLVPGPDDPTALALLKDYQDKAEGLKYVPRLSAAADYYANLAQQARDTGVIVDENGNPHLINSIFNAKRAMAGATAAGPLQVGAGFHLVPITITDAQGKKIEGWTQEQTFTGPTGQGAPVTSGAGTGGGAGGGGGVPGYGPGSMISGKPVMTPEEEGRSRKYAEISDRIIDANYQAPVILGKVAILRNAANVFRNSTFGGQGPSAPQRLEMAARFADLINQLGGTVAPGLKNMIESGQIINKENGMLTAEQVRQLGSREGQQIYAATANWQPGITMSDGGFDAIVNSIEQGVRRSQDLYNFHNAWLGDRSHGGTIAGMQEAFDKAHPIEEYASRVVPMPMKLANHNYLPNVIYSTPGGARVMYDPGSKTFSDAPAQ